jgi:hypothetical protein
MQSGSAIRDSHCHRSRLASVEGFQNRHFHPKQELEHQDFISKNDQYIETRNRVNQYNRPVSRKLLVDEKDILDFKMHVRQEIWDNLVENDLNRSVRHLQLSHTDQESEDRRKQCLLERRPSRASAHPPVSLPPRPAASHISSRPPQSSLSQTLIRTALPRRAADAPAAAACAAPAQSDQALLRQAFAAAVGERRSRARAWREQRTVDAAGC